MQELSNIKNQREREEEEIEGNQAEQGIGSQIKEQKVRKSRAAKKRQKLQLKQKQYDTVQSRQERRKATKQRMKAKHDKEVQGMTKEEAIEFVTRKRQQKQLLKQKMLRAQQLGLPILIDCAYESQMNQKQRRSLGVQVQLIYKEMRKVNNPCSLHLCGIGGSIEVGLKKMGLINLPIGIHKQNAVEVGNLLGKQLIYLSPDAPEVLKQVSDECAYIVGGLVDRSIIKNASFNRADQLGVKAYSLPIQEFMIKRKCLNLDHVALILVKAQETGNWKDAFYSSAPKRYSKEGQTEEKQEHSQSSSLNQQENEIEVQSQQDQKPSK